MTLSRCVCCVYWVESKGEWGEKLGYGECHRYPPISRSRSGAFFFPEVDKSDWCGEFKAKEAE